MTLSEAINEAYKDAKGKYKVLTSTDNDYLYLRSLANIYQRVWRDEEGVNWNSLYSLENLGSITATDEFDIDVYKIIQDEEDPIRVVNGTNTYEFKLTTANKLYKHRDEDYCAKIGATLKFSRTFASTDPEFGGTLFVPALLDIDELEGADDEVVVDDPTWLTKMMAAAYANSKADLQYKYVNLVREAEVLMNRMIENNGGSTDEIDRYETVLGDTTC